MFFPFADAKVVELSLHAPPSFKVRNGYNRFLIRHCLKGILPEPIRWRVSKTPFFQFYPYWLKNREGEIIAYLNSLTSAHPIHEFLDMHRVTQLANIAFKQDSFSGFASWKDLWTLHRILLIARYLEWFNSQS